MSQFVLVSLDLWGPQSLKSTTTATTVGGPGEFGGTKGVSNVDMFLHTKIDQKMNITEAKH